MQSWLSSLRSKIPLLNEKTVKPSAITPVETPLHPDQRFECSWTITEDDVGKGNDASAYIAEVSVTSPGLTVVRRCDSTVTADGARVLARVRVTSDQQEHLERMQVKLNSDKRECVVEYNAKGQAQGHLLTEIEVPNELEEVAAYGSGDCVVYGDVVPQSAATLITPSNDTGVDLSAQKPVGKSFSLQAFFGARMFLWAPHTDLACSDLDLSVMGPSSLHIKARNVHVSEAAFVGVIGAGHVNLDIQQFKAPDTMYMGIGHGGDATILSRTSFESSMLKTGIVGKNLFDVCAPLTGEHASHSQFLYVRRGGRVDIADLPAELVAAYLAGGSSVAIHAPSHFVSANSDSGVCTVEYVGELPDPAPKSDEKLEVKPLDPANRRPIQELLTAPSPESAFESPVPLVSTPEGTIAAMMAGLIRPSLQAVGLLS